MIHVTKTGWEYDTDTRNHKYFLYANYYDPQHVMLLLAIVIQSTYCLLSLYNQLITCYRYIIKTRVLRRL